MRQPVQECQTLGKAELRILEKRLESQQHMNLWFKLCLKLPYFWRCKIHKAIHSLFVTSSIFVISVFTDVFVLLRNWSILNNRQSKGQSQASSLPRFITFISLSSLLYLCFFYSSSLSPLFPTFQLFHSSKLIWLLSTPLVETLTDIIMRSRNIYFIEKYARAGRDFER